MGHHPLGFWNSPNWKTISKNLFAAAAKVEIKTQNSAAVPSALYKSAKDT